MEEELKKLIDRATVMGLRVIEPETICGHKYYIINISSDNHIVYIPSDVKQIASSFNGFNVYTEELQNLRGTVKVQGGENIANIDNLFSRCKLDVLDLRRFKLTNRVSATGLFQYSKIKEIIFGDNIWELIDLEKAFDSGTFGKLDLNNWKVNTIKDLNYTFCNANISELKIDAWNLQSLTEMEFTFYGVNIDKLDLSNINLTKLESISGIFEYAHIGELLLHNKDFKSSFVLKELLKNDKILKILHI